MVLPRIWLSCAADGNNQQEVALTQRLISDLRKAGAEVVSESAALSDEQFLPFLQRELAACQWFILVQTSQGMRSEREQRVLQEARSCHGKGLLRGAFLVSASLDGWEEPVPWPEMKSYVYKGDYPRLRDKLLLDLDLLQVSDVLMEMPDDIDIKTNLGRLSPAQKIPDSQQQTFPENAESGRLQSPSISQSSSPFSNWRRARGGVGQYPYKTMGGDRPALLPWFSSRVLLYSVVSICLVLIVSAVVLAKDMMPAPSSAPTALTHPTTRPHSPTLTHPTTPTSVVPTPTVPTPPTATAQPAPTCGPAVSDSFQSNINPSVWQFYNDSGQGSYSVVSPGTLAMTAPPNADLNPDTNENAPGLVQNISGNFTIETQVEKPANAPTNAFWAMGLALAWVNSDSYFRVEMNTTTFDFEQSINGVFNHDAPAALANANISASQAQLRLVRSGNTVSAYYSLPGQSWQLINTVNAPLQGQALQVGLDLVNITNAPFTGYYNYFNVTCN